MYVFGSGVLIGTPSGGSPINFGLAQEVTLNISTTTKALYGQNNFPVAIGSGARKMTGKAKLARISGQALGNLFFGVNPSVGGVQTQFGEVTSVPAVSPFTYSTNFHATFIADQGVVYASTGLPLKAVASSPAAGQYSVSAGVYTFAAPDTGIAMKIDYTYTIAASGEKISIVNNATGLAPNFKGVFTQSYNSLRQTLVLNACVSSKLSIASKLEDFNMKDFDFAGMADSAENIGTWSLGEAS